MSKAELVDICRYRTDSIPVDPQTYISTESMLPNRAGVTAASSIPSTGKARVFRKGDTLVSNIRPYFKKIWQATADGCCSADVLVFEPSNCDADYLYWLLSDDSFFDYMVATSKGTKMPRGDKAAIVHYEFERMDDKDQVAIANALNPIRELININQQTNDYLEALGGALVERYIASCDGAIPLKDLLDLGNGFAFKSGTYVDNGKYKVLTIKNVQDGNVDCSGANRIDEIPSRMKEFCRLNLGDVVLSLTGNVGRVGIVSEPDCVLNQRVAVFLPNAKNSLAGLYFWFRQDAFKDRMIGIARGTAQANLSPIETLQLEIPFDEDGFAELCADAQPLYDAILANKTEMIVLTSLRDALLPKLMSGEIDVSQVGLSTLPNNHLSAD